MKIDFKAKIEHSIRRRVDHFFFPMGINLMPKAYPPVAAGDSRQDVFNQIFDSNSWGSAESRSGMGSELGFTKHYREKLLELLRQEKISSMIDAPCGDLLWMKEVLKEIDLNYIGGDISSHLVAKLKLQYPNLKIGKFDICVDPFPEVDLWHCRDCLFHLPNKDIFLALENFARSSVPWALITSHQSLFHRNLDVAIGGFRLLDLERAPFRLPPPTARLADYQRGKDFPRYVGLWSREAIAAALQRHRSRT